MIFTVTRTRYELNETCCICLGWIGAGQVYARTESKAAHYGCAKKRNWKRKSRAKKKLARIEQIRPRIKVVRNGEIIKVI